MNSNLLKNFSGKLAQRFVIYVIVASTMFTLLTSAIQLYDGYLRDINNVDSRLDELEHTQLSALSLSLWDFDDEGLSVAAESVLAIGLIQYVEIRDNDKIVITLGDKNQEGVKRKEFPLFHEAQDMQQRIGTLIIHASLEQVYQHILEQALIIIVGNGIKTFIVSGIILLVFYQTIGKHLTNMGNFAANVYPEEPVQKLKLDRKPSTAKTHDELDFVVDAINSMQEKLVKSVFTLQASELRFRRLFENSDISIWNEDLTEVYQELSNLRQKNVTDLRRYLEENEHVAVELASKVKVLQVNEATLKLFETKDEHEFLTRIDTTFGPDAIDIFKEELCAIWDGQSKFSAEATFRTFSGKELTAIISFQIPQTEDGFRDMPINLTDITERKFLEEQVRRSQKMEAVGQLTGGIAHDFNNILGIILGNLEIITKLPPSDSRIYDRAQQAKQSVERGADITRKLLSFSRKELHHVQATAVNVLIETLLSLIAKSLTVSIEIKTHLADTLWTVDMDPGDFEDAILNLALNARDAMPDGGTLSIATENKVLNEEFVKQNSNATNTDYVRVSIEDTGAGMTDETKDRIFEPFFTTKDKGKGTGLGLSMVYGFVERSGGFLKIESKVGAGTTFNLYFPRSANQETNLIETTNAQDELPQGTEKILIVDDEKGLRDVAAFVLEELGYKTLVAGDGTAALKILEQERDIDLLFTDVVMPNLIDGYELAQRAHKLVPDLNILLTSGYTSKRPTIENSADEFLIGLTKRLLNKPYSTSEMAIAIRKGLDEKP
ncbi:MAG: ATP-binding protein [Sneathiella sp.]